VSLGGVLTLSIVIVIVVTKKDANPEVGAVDVTVSVEVGVECPFSTPGNCNLVIGCELKGYESGNQPEAR